VEALECLDKERVDTVIVNARIGAIDGLDVLTFVTESHPQVRRVLMAGSAPQWKLDAALSSGRAHALIGKPWTRDSLIAACA
jgi:response regulator RpfG family c-di-GMP phosphodiesterase